MSMGLVFNIQKYSIHDGPGIRTTVFLKGCPLECWWCHNPESQSAEPDLTVIAGSCVQCVAACPTEARQLVGRRMTVAETLAEILQDRIFYDESGGGVTLSGGEPL